jgi:hypothetical protein
MKCERCNNFISLKEQTLLTYCDCNVCGNLPKMISQIFEMYPLCFDCIKELKEDKKYSKRIKKYLKKKKR